MSHPYESQKDEAFWSRGVAALAPHDINPARPAPFKLSGRDKIVTAGSCFAQNIGLRLPGMGLNYLVTEPGHSIFPDELKARFGYGLFSARYGNLYTARQLLQLWYRAYGAFQPREDVWNGPGGMLIDPFRPRIQPGGFLTPQEYQADRASHFAAVRAAFETMDVFIFTLGLTESWRDRADGAVFPLCPGVAGGAFDPARHEFHNFTADEIISDLVQFIDTIRRRNSGCRFILTVSPVPLVATAQPDEHVLASTFHAKSILLAAARAAALARPNAAYFPAYETIMSRAFYDGSYFEPDRRSVTKAGVDHVMRCFTASFTNQDTPPPAATQDETQARLARMEAAMQTHCDEMALDSFAAQPDISGQDL